MNYLEICQNSSRILLLKFALKRIVVWALYFILLHFIFAIPQHEVYHQNIHGILYF